MKQPECINCGHKITSHRRTKISPKEYIFEDCHVLDCGCIDYQGHEKRKIDKNVI